GGSVAHLLMTQTANVISFGRFGHVRRFANDEIQVSLRLAIFAALVRRVSRQQLLSRRGRKTAAAADNQHSAARQRLHKTNLIRGRTRHSNGTHWHPAPGGSTVRTPPPRAELYVRKHRSRS